MTSVEEMLEGYEWASDDILGRIRSRAVDRIAARLQDELMALEKANIHSFIESDDRVTLVLKFLDDAILELDNMDSLVSSYKIHLNAVNEDIVYSVAKQRPLGADTEPTRVTRRTGAASANCASRTRSDDYLDTPDGIQALEEAAAELYKALQA
ncbi:hypothetical protein EDB89DRAFT_347060 [Lactarius sanguifluus]|nr:hypothetical protein EDB89DRAFT_347060 [Lactarius sanguifluus]